jgi:hypothetical protein
MFFRIKRLTTEIFEVQSGDEASFSTLLLNSDEITLLRKLLKESLSLPVAKTTEGWYNS